MRKKVFLWKEEVPNNTKEKNDAIIEFDKESNVTKLVEVTNPLFEVFHPQENKNNKKAIIICPGGSYQILAIDKEGVEPALWLNKLGYTAYVLHYRVPNNREGAFNDIVKAFKMIKNNYNHSQIGVLGFSAGAHLSARLSTHYSNNSYNTVDKIDNVSFKPNFTLLIYPAYLDEGAGKSISPNLICNKNINPIFIFGTKDDAYFNSTKTFANYLKELKTNFELQTITSGGHGYGLRKGNIAAETWPILAENWLNSLTE